MRICVTGGAGMIGSRLVRRLCGLRHRVTVVDNLWRGRLDYLEGIEGFDVQRDFHNIDLSDASRASELTPVLAQHDAVVHLADIVAGIGYVFNNQYEVFRANNLINTNTWRAVAESRIKRVLYAGTACSWPKNMQRSLDSVLREEDLFPAEPESAYGWSKLAGSLELQFLAERSDMQTTTLMLHNVYGPNCDVDPRRSQVIPSLMRRMIELKPGEPLTVWGSGKQGRAFLHVDDVASAFVAALDRNDLPPFIQIGPDHCTSIRELVEILRDDVARRDIAIEFDTTKPEGDLGRCADYSLATRTLGWSPSVDIVDGLTETYEWVERELARVGCVSVS
jgi:nucleoside-diphosphate-sugar epimerase